jgi:hypothetical protein
VVGVGAELGLVAHFLLTFISLRCLKKPIDELLFSRI